MIIVIPRKASSASPAPGAGLSHSPALVAELKTILREILIDDPESAEVDLLIGLLASLARSAAEKS